MGAGPPYYAQTQEGGPGDFPWTPESQVGAAVDICWGFECGTLPLQTSISPCVQQLLCVQSRGSEENSGGPAAGSAQENREAAGSAQHWDSPSSGMGGK